MKSNTGFHTHLRINTFYQTSSFIRSTLTFINIRQTKRSCIINKISEIQQSVWNYSMTETPVTPVMQYKNVYIVYECSQRLIKYSSATVTDPVFCTWPPVFIYITLCLLYNNTVSWQTLHDQLRQICPGIQ